MAADRSCAGDAHYKTNHRQNAKITADRREKRKATLHGHAEFGWAAKRRHCGGDDQTPIYYFWLAAVDRRQRDKWTQRRNGRARGLARRSPSDALRKLFPPGFLSRRRRQCTAKSGRLLSWYGERPRDVHFGGSGETQVREYNVGFCGHTILIVVIFIIL